MKRFAVLRWTVLFVACSCTATRLPHYEAKPVDAYALRSERDGLVVAAEAMTDETALNTYFGENLVADGVLPLLIVAENRHPTKSVILREGDIRLVQAVARAKDDDVGAGTAARAVGAAATVSILLAPAAGIVLMPTAATMFSTAKEQNYSFLMKQLRSHTLSPGERVSGFVYFKLDGAKPPPESIIHVSAARPGGEGLSLEVPLHIRGTIRE